MNVIAISLERRKDRRQRLEKHLSELGYANVFYMPAYDGALLPSTNITPPHRPYFSFKDEFGNPTNRINNYVIGCTLSHMACIKMAKALNLEYVMIVEDDVELTKGPEFIEDKVKQLPDLWGMYYLGGAVRSWIDRSHGKPGFVDGIHAYVLRNTAYDRVLRRLNMFLTSTDDSFNDARLKGNDPVLAYIIEPKIAFQYTNFSELDRKVVDRYDLR